MEYIEKVPTHIIKLFIGVSLGLIAFSGTLPSHRKLLQCCLQLIHHILLLSSPFTKCTLNSKSSLLCALGVIQEYVPALIESKVNTYFPIFQTYSGRGVVYIV